MRFAVPLLACALAGAATAALADPPAASASPAAAPAAAATPATPPSTVAPATPAAAAMPAVAHASAAAANDSEAATATESRLRTAGYKPQTVNGVKIWCRTENSIGSRLAQQKNCGTAEDLERSVRETQDRFEATQHRQWSPTNH